jgi:hypothetical protein
LLNEKNATAVERHKLLLVRHSSPDGLVKHLPVLKKFFASIMKAVIQVQADKATLCRMRALVRELEAHAECFTATYHDLCEGVVKMKNQPNRAEKLFETFNLRLRVFYKPAITASFLLDPFNSTVRDYEGIQLPFEMLSTPEEDEATDRAVN